jgi:hypothetical protein
MLSRRDHPAATLNASASTCRGRLPAPSRWLPASNRLGAFYGARGRFVGRSRPGPGVEGCLSGLRRGRLIPWPAWLATLAD